MTTLDAIRGRFERDPGSLTLADIRDLLAIADAAAALLAAEDRLVVARRKGDGDTAELRLAYTEVMYAWAALRAALKGEE
jgi:hypothetical protein